MSNEIGKITYKGTNSEISVYTELKDDFGMYKNPIGNLFGINTDEIKNVLSKIDTGTKNGYLSEEEISIFNDKVKEYASKDSNKTELSEAEAKGLCRDLGISLKNLVNIMNLLGSNSLSKGLAKALDSKNEEQVSKILSELNATNVYNVLNQYKGDLVKDIQLACGSNAKKYLDIVHSALQNAANSKNVKIDTLTEAYTKAKSSSAIQKSFDEILIRLEMAQKSEQTAKEYQSKNGTCNLNNIYVDKIIAKAKASGAENTPDLIGDGIVGNHESVQTVNSDDGKYQKVYKPIVDAINELMQDPIIAEKIQACVRKENNILTVIFPGSKSNPAGDRARAVASIHLNTYAGKDANNIIGDADMSALVQTIEDEARLSSRKFTRFEDQDALKYYILGLIDPNH